MNDEQTTSTSGLSLEYRGYEKQRCFVGHSLDAPWRQDLVTTIDEVMPSFGLEPWYAAEHFSPTQSLREKVVELIANTRYGIYDLSYWRADDKSEWRMPRNVFIELGMAIALNRPMLLLRHRSNSVNQLSLPQCPDSIRERILEFSGVASLRLVLKEQLAQWADAPPDQDWWNRYCTFGRRVCEYREAHPHVQQWGNQTVRCHISDGKDADRLDFREVVEDVLSRFDDVTFDYLDNLSLCNGYNFLLCTHCQTVRSTPFAIYRITSHTPPETFIAIGMSLALETQFKHKIPKILLTANLHDIPSLLTGYEVLVARNDSECKARLHSSMPQVIQVVRNSIWKPSPLPFIEVVPRPAEKPSKETEGTELLSVSTSETSIQRAKSSTGAPTILLCYAQEDESMARQLKKQLSLLDRNGLIALWDSGNISPGSQWEQELKKHLDEADIILLLISSSFLASNYCYTVEMQRAIERHERKEARVIPVILRPAHWAEPPIDKLLALPDDAKPISRWRNRDEGFKNVADGIKKVIEQWNLRSLSGPIPERKALIADLDQLVETVKVQMQPPPRGSAVAASLQELSIFIPNDVTLADLVVGWRTLAQASQAQEEPATAQRRVTCNELATLASQFTTGQGNLAQAIKTWHSWQETFKNSDDPRHATMARTFARELTELQEAQLLPHKGRAVILTAIESEYRAVRLYLSDIHEEVYQGTIYERGYFPARASMWEVLIDQVGVGKAVSAAAVERIISYFDPDLLLFVGIAGGVKDVKIGDVVVATKVYGYEWGKVDETGFVPRPEVGISSLRLIERAKAEAREKTWLRRIPGYPNLSHGEPRAFVGPIAAGEKVFASTNSELFAFLRNNFNDTLAVEMEGDALFAAAYVNGFRQAMIIRGITDLIDNKSTFDAQSSQELATSHAAAFAFEVLAQYNVYAGA